MKTKTFSPQKHRAAEVERLQIGAVCVARLPGRRGKLWLTNANGEGMETRAAKLGAWLEQYFNREF